MNDKSFEPQWEAFFKQENKTKHLPDEVITLDIEPPVEEDDFEVDVVETTPHSIKSLEEMGGELYRSLQVIRKQIKQKNREENPTMLDANIHTTFDLFIKGADEAAEHRVARLATESLAEKLGKFYEAHYNVSYRIVEEKVFVSTREFVEAQGANADQFLRLLSPAERSSFLKKRALSKLTAEEREALGLS